MHSQVSLAFWIGFIILVAALLILDLVVLNKKGSSISVKKALWHSLFWISLALLFNVWVYFEFGKEKAIEFLTAYIIEESLSVDNLFVFIIIFASFNIKPAHQHKILFLGIIGAIVFRAIFIFAGIAIIEQFSWVMYLFGGFLLVTGIKMIIDKIKSARSGHLIEKKDASDNKLVRLLKKVMPVTEDMSEPKFFKRIDHKLHATPFFLTLVVIEFSDVIFAVDSIPAVLSVSTDTFIVYTSNIFAILGLRALYFALRGVMDLFYFLKYALSGILFFIGFKMIVNEYSMTAGWEFHISNIASLAIIASLLAISIVASLMKSKRDRRV